MRDDAELLRASSAASFIGSFALRVCVPLYWMVQMLTFKKNHVTILSRQTGLDGTVSNQQTGNSWKLKRYLRVNTQHPPTALFS